MENQQENKYFILWLCISILLHLVVMIIMLLIKQTAKPAFPFKKKAEQAQVIFKQEKPEPKKQEPKKPDFKMAKREQGGPVSTQQSQPNPKDAQRDIPKPALSKKYKKGMENQTKIKDQDPSGEVDIPENAIIDKEKQSKKQIIELQNIPVTSQFKQPQVATKSNIKSLVESEKKQTIPTKDPNEKIQDKVTIQTIPDKIEELPQPEIQKIVSRQHRTADLGTENISKVQLSKEIIETTPQKKKISLQALQQGFSQFIRNGNEQNFSAKGNAQQDDAEGLKRASYYKQLGQMYHSAHAIAPKLINTTQPTNSSVVMVTIDRSGTIDNCQITTSCGVDSIDQGHIKIIESIGSFPPIPKYIEAPLQVTATWGSSFNQSFTGSFYPSKTRR